MSPDQFMVRCPDCAVLKKAPRSAVGRLALCSNCGLKFRIQTEETYPSWMEEKAGPTKAEDIGEVFDWGTVADEASAPAAHPESPPPRLAAKREAPPPQDLVAEPIVWAECPCCRARSEVRENQLGDVGECHHCGEVVTFRAAADAAPADGWRYPFRCDSCGAVVLAKPGKYEYCGRCGLLCRVPSGRDLLPPPRVPRPVTTSRAMLLTRWPYVVLLAPVAVPLLAVAVGLAVLLGPPLLVAYAVTAGNEKAATPVLVVCVVIWLAVLLTWTGGSSTTSSPPPPMTQEQREHEENVGHVYGYLKHQHPNASHEELEREARRIATEWELAKQKEKR